MRENDDRENQHREKIHKTVNKMSDKAQEQFAKVKLVKIIFKIFFFYRFLLYLEIQVFQIKNVGIACSMYMHAWIPTYEMSLKKNLKDLILCKISFKILLDLIYYLYFCKYGIFFEFIIKL